jgi:hypothetical protein
MPEEDTRNGVGQIDPDQSSRCGARLVAKGTRMRAFLVAGVACLLLVSGGAALAQETGGYITGTLIDEVSGQPIADMVGVTAHDTSGIPVATSNPTDAAGVYVLGPLPAGEYRLRFEDARLTGLASEWWKDRPDLASADVVSVSAGATIAGIDFRLAPPPIVGGYVAGRLMVRYCSPTWPPGSSLGERYPFAIRVYSPDGALQSEWFLTAGPNGSYRLGPVPTGTYDLAFTDRAGAPQQISLFGTVEGVEVVVDQTATADFVLGCASGWGGDTTLPYTGLPTTAMTVALAALGLGALLLRRARSG